jgi:predicted permease
VSVILLFLPLGVIVGLAVRRRVSDQIFRLLFRRVLVTITLVRGCLAGWAFQGVMHMIGVIAVVAGSEVLCAYVLARAGPLGHRPVAGFAAHSNTGYWALPLAAVMFGSAGVTFVTVYEMLAAPRVAPAVRRLQRHARAATTAAERTTDLSPVAAALLGLGARTVVTPSPWAVRVLLPLAVAAGAVGAISFGLSIPARRPVKEHVAAASAVVAVRAVLLPAPLLIFAVLGLYVPAVAWVVVTGLTPFNTVVLGRLYGYDTGFGITVVGLSAFASVLTVLVVALGWLVLG